MWRVESKEVVVRVCVCVCKGCAYGWVGRLRGEGCVKI